MNGYFKLKHVTDKMILKLIPPSGDGKPVNVNDVIDYMTMKDYACDLPTLKRAVDAAADKEVVFVLGQGKRAPERECYKLTITPDKMYVYAKFYEASEGGGEVNAGEILRDLEARGVKSSIKKDAYIEYKFNTNKKAKPTLNEDGSVDFFNLNILNHCGKGDVLAILYREEPGELGEDIYGTRIRPPAVKTEKLKRGAIMHKRRSG